MTAVLAPAPVERPALFPEELVVTVTQKHIREGICQDPHHCAVAVAIRDMGYPDAEVHHCLAVIYGEGQSRRYIVPENLSAWIEDYDATHEGFPERFVLRAA